MLCHYRPIRKTAIHNTDNTKCARNESEGHVILGGNAKQDSQKLANSFPSRHNSYYIA